MADPTTATHAIIDAERQAQEMSYAELSRRAGLPPTTVYDILTGRRPDPQMSTTLALLGGLGRDLRLLHSRGLRPPPERIPDKSPQ